MCSTLADATDSIATDTFFAQLERRTGICEPWRIATAAGLTRASGEPLGQDPSFTLGPYEVSPLGMAEAYATFAARGLHCESFAVEKVRDRARSDVYTARPDCDRVLDKRVADNVNRVLRGVIDSPGATGIAMRLDGGRVAAGKTGTTTNAIAVWWVGYVPQLATAVAVYDPDVDPETGRVETLDGRTYNGQVVASACGSCIPGPIWKQMMDAATADVPSEPFANPGSP